MINTMSRRFPTFIDGNFKGYLDEQEIFVLKNKACENAQNLRKTMNADHLIYGYFSLNENGELETARLYSGIAKNDSEYHTIIEIPNSIIYALHKN